MTYSKTPSAEYRFYFWHPTDQPVSWFTSGGPKCWGRVGYHKEADARHLARLYPHLTLCRVEED